MINEHYPGFECLINNEGNVSWEGEVLLPEKYGPAYYSPFRVKITCLADYPEVVPFVKDVEGMFEGKNPHVEPGGRICTENGCSGDEKLYEGNKRIWGTIQDVENILIQHWVFLQDGEDIAGQPHGFFAFVDYELKNGCHALDAKCLCKRYKKSYRDCCYSGVVKVLTKWNGNESAGRQKGAEKCHCDSGRSFRKCGMKNRCMRYCEKEHPRRGFYKKMLINAVQQQRNNDKAYYGSQ